MTDPAPTMSAGGEGGRSDVGDNYRRWGVADLTLRRREAGSGSSGGLGFGEIFWFLFFLLAEFVFACGWYKRPHAKIVIFAYLLAHAVGATICKNPFHQFAKMVFVVVYLATTYVCNCFF